MEAIKAMVSEINGKHFIKIEIRGEEIKIPISEDKPNEVKKAFNRLVARIKEGEFGIVLEEVGSDLFSQVANEYITQLNREILEVRREMENHCLVEKE
jgi:GGDEF domain-containing protein